MPREAPKIQVPGIKPIGQEQTDRITQIRRYALMTPLFGGGVEPAEADPVTVVRASSIRGQLRFWWRASRGGQFGGNLQKMKEKEDKIWGTAARNGHGHPSQVQVRVDVIKAGQSFQARSQHNEPVAITDSKSPYAYAAFPLSDKPQARVREGIEFQLGISFPLAQQDEVEAALWAWETFGGIGARTRRGFGALRYLDGETPPANEFKQALRKQLDRYVVAGDWPEGVTHLVRDLDFRISGTGSPLQIWSNLIQKLMSFRQRRRGSRFGSSFWPEPNAIRSLTRRNLGKLPVGVRPVMKFPRAAFGLPIIFHFQKQAVEPANTTLKQPGRERWASPLILKPVACANGQVVGLAALLEPHTVPQDLVLEMDHQSLSKVDATVTPGEAAVIEPLQGNPDVLHAFLDTL